MKSRIPKAIDEMVVPADQPEQSTFYRPFNESAAAIYGNNTYATYT